MTDGYLLRLFGFTKTLEELDGIDLARLNRALEAMGYADAYQRWTGPGKTKDAEDGRKVTELRWAAING